MGRIVNVAKQILTIAWTIMAERWEKVPFGGPASYEITKAGWLWLMKIKELTHAKIALVDGAGLRVSSNNPNVVPNDDAVFKGKMTFEKRRIIEFYGLSPGTTLIEARKQDGTYVMSLQVKVEELPGNHHSLIALTSPTAALNAPDTPVPYRMTSTFTVKKGEKAKDVFAKVPSGINHLTISCHGFQDASRGEFVLDLGEGIGMSKKDALSGLTGKGLKVIWVGGCAVGGAAPSLCEEMAKRASSHVVAPFITLPPAKPGAGQVEMFKRSMPIYFDPKGSKIAAKDFFRLAPDLKFKIV